MLLLPLMQLSFSTASDLVRYANTYLDSLVGNPPKDEEETKERIRTILLLKREMDRMNFKNPRASIAELSSLLDLSDLDEEEKAELFKALRALRYAFNLRTWTYLRARAAYIAHRTFLHTLKFPFYPELSDALPFGGEYRAFLEPFGATGYLIVRELILDVPGKSKFVKYVVASSVVRAALGRIWEEIKRKEREEIPNYERIVEYERIVIKYDLRKAREDPSIIFSLLSELEEKSFLIDGDVDPAILEGLRKRRILRLREGRKFAKGLLKSLLLRYYALVPVRERRTLPLFPGLPENPESVTILDRKMLTDAEIVASSLGPEGLFTFIHLKGLPVEGWKEELRDKVRSVLGEKARRFMEALKG